MRTIFIINPVAGNGKAMKKWMKRSEEHTSELQSPDPIP